MQTKDNNYSVAEIYEMIQKKSLVINRDYQRGSDLWPLPARSYFIDTIVNGFPFPKIYFYESLDEKLKVRREVVDGQQRITTIVDFIDGGFALSGSVTHAGSRFEDLDEDVQRAVMQYTVSVDVIRDAAQAQIVEMFRRMNAYTLPLNDAEKRHAGFQGEFKWAINALADDIGEFTSQFGIFTKRQMVRMADQELLAEAYLFREEGFSSSSPSILRDLYKRFDKEFPDAKEFADDVRAACQFVAENMPKLRSSFMMKPYAFYTLLTALVFNKNGLAPEGFAYRPMKRFAADAARAEERLLRLAAAHEAKEVDGPYSEYVQGCLSGTNRIQQRQKRFKSVIGALQVL